MDPPFEALKGRMEERLHIEDPFQLSRNLHCVLRTESEYVLYYKIVEGMQAMFRGEVPVGLAPLKPPTPQRTQLAVKEEPRKIGTAARAGYQPPHFIRPISAQPLQALPPPAPPADAGSGPAPDEVPMTKLQRRWFF